MLIDNNFYIKINSYELRRDLEEVDKEMTIYKKGKVTKLFESRVERERHKSAIEEKRRKLQF